jgi:hypothetical protein
MVSSKNLQITGSGIGQLFSFIYPPFNILLINPNCMAMGAKGTYGRIY